MSKKHQLTKTDYLSTEEYQKLITGLHEDHDVLGETYARIAKATALRISDVLRIKWCQVLVSKFTFDEQKTKKRRPIPFAEKTLKIMHELYNMNGAPGLDSLVFMNSKTGKPYTKQHINQCMKVWKSKYHLNVGNFSSHSFRKSFGRELWDKMNNSDYALTTLSEIFNHSNIAITRRYLGIRDEEIAEAYEMIEV